MTPIGLGIGLLLMTSAQKPEGLRPLAEKIRLNLGAAVPSDALKENIEMGRYQKSVLDNYTMIEPENDLKPLSGTAWVSTISLRPTSLSTGR